MTMRQRIAISGSLLAMALAACSSSETTTSGSGGSGGHAGAAGAAGGLPTGGSAGAGGDIGGGAGSGGAGGATPDTAFLTGWWIDVDHPGELAGFASHGNTLVLATSAGWFAQEWMRHVIQEFLDEADANGIQVILGMTTGWDNAQDFSDTIAQFSTHHALYGWYLADEPEIQANADEIYGWLKTDPGYYALAKAADPNHPTFNMEYDLAVWDQGARRFYDVTDMIGMHNYPFWNVNPEPFGGGDARGQYDKWKLLLDDAEAYVKVGSIATCQGFGNNTTDPYRTPTFDELRYQAFSAVVQGQSRVLFWMYNDWGENDPVAVDNVNQMAEQIQSIGAEMNAGLSADPAVGVSQPGDSLAYRHGAVGQSHVILAVNIANRQDPAGATLDVELTLPAGSNVSEVEVVHENRTIAVSGDAFADTFAPFAVHIYRYLSP
jgi:hypothetical protein